MSAASRLHGRRIIVTAGGTREPIDPVRYLGNRSSGKMGNAIAAAAADAGAVVTLISAASAAPVHPRVSTRRVETSDEMHAAVRAALPGAAALIMAAAVADYRPARVSAIKLKKTARPWSLELVPAVDILASLRDAPDRAGVVVVGFAAETDDLLENAQRKVREKGLDLIVLNDVGRVDIAMGADDNEVTVIDATGVVCSIAKAPKSEVARRLLELVAERLR